jgi:Transglycosylase SLT domain.
MLAWGKLTP